MSKGVKIFLGILSFLSILMIPTLILVMFGTFIPEIIEMEEQGIEPDARQMLPLIGGFMTSIMLFGLISLGLYIFYIIHVVQDKSATSNDRVMWILLIVFLSNLVYPFYWYFRIWKDNGPVESDQSLDAGIYKN